MRSFVWAAAVLAAAHGPVRSDVLRWGDGLCRATLRYDPRKVDGASAKSTADLLVGGTSDIPVAPGVSTPADLEKLRPETFDAECKAVGTRLRTATLLPVPGVDAFRSRAVMHVEDACTFELAKLRGYTNPSALRDYRRAAGRCDGFIDALEGEADLRSSFRARLADQCSTNLDPARCRREHEVAASKPDGEQSMRIYLTSFGWGNCATRSTMVNVERGEMDATRERLRKAFYRGYRVREACDRD